jgi:hypothetical protein
MGFWDTPEMRQLKAERRALERELKCWAVRGTNFAQPNWSTRVRSLQGRAREANRQQRRGHVGR